MTMQYIIQKESKSLECKSLLSLRGSNGIESHDSLYQSSTRYLEVGDKRIVYFTLTSTNRIGPGCRFTSNVIPGVVVSEEKTDEYGVTFVEVEPILDPQLRKTLEERLRQEVPEADQPAYYW